MQDIIQTGKSNDEWGIEGYTIRKFDPFMDKAPSFKITKNKPRDFIGDITKFNKDFPGPNKYSTEGSMVFRKQLSIYKLPRITAFAEEQKRNKNPSPGQYH